MTYDQGVGIDRGGQFAQTAAGAGAAGRRAGRGTDMAAAGREAFSRRAWAAPAATATRPRACAARASPAASELEEFRGVHGHGLFPPSVVTDRDFAAINAWLRTLGSSGARGG